MRREQFSAEIIREYILKHILATMEQLKKELGTTVDMTVYRKLKQLPYITSYSHQGKFYSLKQLAKYNAKGLWKHGAARFSKYGTLVDTVCTIIDKSPQGYQLDELRSLVGVDVKETLLILYRKNRLQREIIGGRSVYFSSVSHINRKQHLLRVGDKPSLSSSDKHDLLAHEVRAAIILFFSILDEKHRRLYAGLESLRIGQGGDSIIARMLGIDLHTVARGRRELLEQDIDVDRVRRKGAGRRSVKKNS